jgi:DNA modification methylase
MDGVKAKLLLTDPPYGIKADKGFSGAGGFSGKGKPIERRHYKDEWDSERPEKDVFDYICLMAEKAIIFGGNFFTDELPVGNHWLVWNKHNTMPTFSDAELAWTNIKRNSVKIYDVEWNGLIGKEKERFHPTQKPVKLFADILNDYTEKDDTICDFFGGSGSTLIACEQLNRKCFMCELDSRYVDVIIQRYINLKGSNEDVFLIRDGQRTPYSEIGNC